MASPDHLVLAAGTLAFASNFKDAGGFPENGVATIAGTAALAFVMATVKNGRLSGPATAFAALVLLVAVYKYVPGFVNTKRKRKTNG